MAVAQPPRSSPVPRYKPDSVTQTLVHISENQPLWSNSHFDSLGWLDFHGVSGIRTPHVCQSPFNHLNLRLRAENDRYGRIIEAKGLVVMHYINAAHIPVSDQENIRACVFECA